MPAMTGAAPEPKRSRRSRRPTTPARRPLRERPSSSSQPPIRAPGASASATRVSLVAHVGSSSPPSSSSPSSCRTELPDQRRLRPRRSSTTPPPRPRRPPAQGQPAPARSRPSPRPPRPVTKNKPKPEFTAPIDDPPAAGDRRRTTRTTGVRPEDQFGSRDRAARVGERASGWRRGVEGGVAGRRARAASSGGVLGGTGHRARCSTTTRRPGRSRSPAPQYPQEAFVKKVEGHRRSSRS